MSQLGFQCAHIIASYKRALDQLVWLCALHSASQSSNPSGMDLLAGGGVVYLRVEKNPSSALRQSTGLRPAQSHGSCCAAMYGWGRGSGVFSICVKMYSS